MTLHEAQQSHFDARGAFAEACSSMNAARRHWRATINMLADASDKAAAEGDTTGQQLARRAARKLQPVAHAAYRQLARAELVLLEAFRSEQD